MITITPFDTAMGYRHWAATATVQAGRRERAGDEAEEHEEAGQR
jgi:hypothetical protein